MLFRSPREYERRLLLDTYRTFGSEDGKPTFRYSLLDAVNHQPPYLVNPLALDARTEITTQMLSDEGYAVTVPAGEDGQESELTFGKRDYERKFFSDETNSSFVRCFLDHAKRDPITGEIGKTILFAVSRKHATKLVTLLNEEATRRWPEAYAAGSAFATQVTSDIGGAQQMTIDFANNNLNGRSRWKADEFRDYETGRTRVCVTVGMMTTGYDCEDLLNVVLARPIFSPTDFIQIKGRGTRLFTFKHEQLVAKKDSFALFDFFANCEYFEEDFDYDRKLNAPRVGDGGDGEREDGGRALPGGTFNNTSPDPMSAVVQETIGLWGMKIDREMYRGRFGDAVTTDALLRDAIEREDWAAAEERLRHFHFDKPKEHWNLAKLQDLFKTDRVPSLREILEQVFGIIQSIPGRAQLADEAFDRFITTQETNATRSRELRAVFIAFLLDLASRELLLDGRFGELRTRDASLFNSLSSLASEERKALIAYLKANVALNDFEQVA